MAKRTNIHFLDKFMLSQGNPGAYFRRNSGTTNFLNPKDACSDSEDSDCKCDVIVTSAEDYGYKRLSDFKRRRTKKKTNKLADLPWCQNDKALGFHRGTSWRDHEPTQQERSHIHHGSSRNDDSPHIHRGSSRNDSSPPHRREPSRNYSSHHFHRGSSWKNHRGPSPSSSDSDYSASQYGGSFKQRDKYAHSVGKHRKCRQWGSVTSSTDLNKIKKLSKSWINTVKKFTKEKSSSKGEELSNDNWTLRAGNRKKSEDLLEVKITMGDLRDVITENVRSAIRCSMDSGDQRFKHGARSPEVMPTDTETMTTSVSFSSHSSNEPLLASRRHTRERLQSLGPPRDSCFHSNPRGFSQYLSGLPTVDGSLQTRGINSGLEKRNLMSDCGGSLPHQATAMDVETNLSPSERDIAEELFFRQLDERISQKVEESKLLDIYPGRRSSIAHHLGNSIGSEMAGSRGQVCTDNRLSTTHATVPPHVTSIISPQLPNVPYLGRRATIAVERDVFKVVPDYVQGHDCPQPVWQVPATSVLHSSILPFSSPEQSICLDTRRRRSVSEKFEGKDSCGSADKKDLSDVNEEGISGKEEMDKGSPIVNQGDTFTGLPIPLPTTEMLKRIKEASREKHQFRTGKVLVFVSSILVALLGIGLAGLGVLNIVDGEAAMFVGVVKRSSADQSFRYYSYTLSILGLLAACAWVTGCMGTIKTSCCLLKVYYATLSTLVLLSTAFVCVLIAMAPEAPSLAMMVLILPSSEEAIKHQMVVGVHQRYRESTWVAEVWDRLQVVNECCGALTKDEYKSSAWKNATTEKGTNLPDSCCVVADKNPDNIEPTNRLLCQTLTRGFSHNMGCLSAVMTWYKQNSLITICSFSALVLTEIIGSVLAFYLRKRLVNFQEQQKKKANERVKELKLGNTAKTKSKS